MSRITRFIGSLFGCLPNLVHPVSETSSEVNQPAAPSRQEIDGSSVEEQGIQPSSGVDARHEASSPLDGKTDSKLVTSSLPNADGGSKGGESITEGEFQPSSRLTVDGEGSSLSSTSDLDCDVKVHRIVVKPFNISPSQSIGHTISSSHISGTTMELAHPGGEEDISGCSLSSRRASIESFIGK